MSGRVMVLQARAERLPLPDNSVDAVVCDPPYGLEFMGREWGTFRTGDGFRRSRNDADARRDSVFGRTSRTGPEYLTGKPSAARIRERVDGRTNPAEGKSVTRTPEAYVAGSPFQAWCEVWAAECLRVLKPGGHLLAFGGTRTWHRLACAVEDAGFEIRESVADLTGIDGPGLLWVQGSGFPKSRNLDGDRKGWGTALKPAWEPIVVGRKPFAGTVAANVAEHGTGAMNIDGCRVAPTGESKPRAGERSQETRYDGSGGTDFAALPGVRGGDPDGRWPPNILLGEEAAAELDRQSGVLTSDIPAVRRRSGSDADGNRSAAYGAESRPAGARMVGYGDAGGASRFFPVFRYEAKADAAERPGLADGTQWPTVKPVALMQWLVRLVTPPGGKVLDLFCGTGTTGQACIIEGFDCILLDKDPQALALTRVRLAKPVQPSLFGEAS